MRCNFQIIKCRYLKLRDSLHICIPMWPSSRSRSKTFLLPQKVTSYPSSFNSTQSPQLRVEIILLSLWTSFVSPWKLYRILKLYSLVADFHNSTWYLCNFIHVVAVAVQWVHFFLLPYSVPRMEGACIVHTVTSLPIFLLINICVISTFTIMSKTSMDILI